MDVSLIIETENDFKVFLHDVYISHLKDLNSSLKSYQKLMRKFF